MCLVRESRQSSCQKAQHRSVTVQSKFSLSVVCSCKSPTQTRALSASTAVSDLNLWCCLGKGLLFHTQLISIFDHPQAHSCSRTFAAMDGRYTTVDLEPGAVYINEGPTAKPPSKFDPKRMFTNKSSTKKSGAGSSKQVQIPVCIPHLKWSNVHTASNIRAHAGSVFCEQVNLSHIHPPSTSSPQLLQQTY